MGEYTVAHARAWRDLLAQNHMAHATKVKRFREIATLLKSAWKQDHITTNPFDRVILERPKRAIKRRNVRSGRSINFGSGSTARSSPSGIDLGSGRSRIGVCRWVCSTGLRLGRDRATR